MTTDLDRERDEQIDYEIAAALNMPLDLDVSQDIDLTALLVLVDYRARAEALNAQALHARTRREELEKCSQLELINICSGLGFGIEYSREKTIEAIIDAETRTRTSLDDLKRMNPKMNAVRLLSAAFNLDGQQDVREFMLKRTKMVAELEQKTWLELLDIGTELGIATPNTEIEAIRNIVEHKYLHRWSDPTEPD